MAEQKSTLESGHNAFRVEVVTTPQQFLHVMGVRAICYTEDTQFPMDQAIDGNDYQCTHVIAYLGDEPIGAGRIRWFKDFAKIEIGFAILILVMLIHFGAGLIALFGFDITDRDHAGVLLPKKKGHVSSALRTGADTGDSDAIAGRDGAISA